VRGINLADLRKIPVPIVPRYEQDAVVACINRIEQQTSMEVKNYQKLSLVKSGLMADLLTGRVRVPEGVVA
jgi:type I restriction enzyme, S subunit